MSALVPAGRRLNIVDFFQQMEDDANRKDPERPARIAAAKEKKAADNAAERARVIALFGSEEAALAGTEADQNLAAAVTKFRRKALITYANGKFWTDTLDGWRDSITGQEKVPDRVRKAVVAAIPLPVTIAQAAVEHSYWEARDRQLGLIHECDLADTYLPLEARLRDSIVRELLEHGLRAVSLADAIVRQKYLVEMGRDGLADGVAEAVLADLEHLANIEVSK
jgi:hypothetical protein